METISSRTKQLSMTRVYAQMSVTSHPVGYANGRGSIDNISTNFNVLINQKIDIKI